MSSVNEDIVQTSALSSSLILPPPEAQLSGSSSQESVPSQIAHHPLEERNRPGNWLDGYGDYVFERIVAQFQNTQLGCKLKYPCQSIGIVDDNGFKRSGPFRYEELPLEIRQKIIESLIRPFFHFSEDTNTYWLDLSVEYYCHDIDNPVEDERLPLYERPKVKRRIENPLSYNSYEKATSCRNLTSKLTIVSRDAGDILTGEPYYQTLYSRDERSVRPKVHPYRIGPYNLVASPAHFGQTMVETIRDLSQVSKMFRRDLGSIFWRRVHLSTLSHKHNLLALGPLLIDRPALMARLMCLEIEIDFAWFWKKPQKEEEFAQLCDILESGAQLERFFVRIMFHGETTMYNLSSVGYSCFLQHVRKVNVTGEFELGIRYLGIEGRLPDKDKRRPKKQHLAAIEKLIMPDTIRARQSTAVLDYMVSRLNHCNINDSSGSIHYPRGGTSRVS